MSECLEHNSENRPAANDIVVYLDKLNDETESDSNNAFSSICTDEVL